MVICRRHWESIHSGLAFVAMVLVSSLSRLDLAAILSLSLYIYLSIYLFYISSYLFLSLSLFLIGSSDMFVCMYVCMWRPLALVSYQIRKPTRLPADWAWGISVCFD